MFRCLTKNGFGTRLCHWIESLYEGPIARITVNYIFSDYINIKNDTCQGCPLTPTLFLLALEPLLTHVWLNPDISAVLVKQKHYKIAAYVFFLTNPLISIPNWNSFLETFGKMSNFKINYTILWLWTYPYHIMGCKDFPKILLIQFSLYNRHITSLGILIINDYGERFAVNSKGLLRKLEKDQTSHYK